MQIGGVRLVLIHIGRVKLILMRAVGIKFVLMPAGGYQSINHVMCNALVKQYSLMQTICLSGARMTLPASW